MDRRKEGRGRSKSLSRWVLWTHLTLEEAASFSLAALAPELEAAALVTATLPLAELS